MEEQGKVCTKCGEWKLLEEFNKCKRNKDGRKTICRECQKEYSKQWRENNKEHVKECNKQWRKDNPEYNKQWYKNNPEYSKQWRENNKEHIKEYEKQWRENNPKYYNPKQQRQWRENNKEHLKEYWKQYYQNNKEYKRQYRENNKEHYKALNKQYTENNKEHIKEYKKQYRENNKENNLQYISSIVEQINSIFKQLNLSVYGYVYMFENVKTGHVYIGQTTQLLKDRYGSKEVIKGWIKERKTYENQKFVEELIEEDFEVTEFLDVGCCAYHLDKLESYYINKYNSCENGYNNECGNHNTDNGIEEFNQILKENNLEFINGKLMKIV